MKEFMERYLECAFTGRDCHSPFVSDFADMDFEVGTGAPRENRFVFTLLNDTCGYCRRTERVWTIEDAERFYSEKSEKFVDHVIDSI